MPNIFRLVILAGILWLCTSCQKIDEQRQTEIHLPASIFVNYDVNPQASTLIIKPLIALETGFATSETPFKWDGRERTFAGWNQDQTLRSAYQRSAVWVYQEIAQSLGPDVMSDWLTRFDYGNHTIGGANDITRYWLTGPLEISAVEQVAFLEKLAEKTLPLSRPTYAQAWPIFVNEMQGKHRLYAKTGWVFNEDSMDIGWFVGWVEAGNTQDIYVFAVNMDMPDIEDRHKRKQIAMDGLRAVGAWPNP